jgi:hypothetical protein
MAYWRMQLHPASSGDAVARAIGSLAVGYIGLDFAEEVGDLMATEQAKLPSNQKDYWAFAHTMRENDLVLIVVHHFPFALVRVSGAYNYIRSKAPELKVWFRHFRAVTDVRYYADFKTNAHAWERTIMTDTISPLHDVKSISYRLIEEWKLSTEADGVILP